MRHVLTAVCLAALVAGCSGGGPDKADMQKALTEGFEKEVFAESVEYKTFEVGDCVKDNAVFACPLRGEATVEMRVMPGRTTKTDLPFAGTYRFAEVGGEWALVGVQ